MAAARVLSRWPIRRPSSADLPAGLAGAAALAWAAVTVGPWLLIAGVGMAAAALTSYRWPTTAAAALLLLGDLLAGPPQAVAVVSGLLVAAYLVLLDGVPSPAGLVPMVAGVLAVEVAIWLTDKVATAPSVWWSLGAAIATPLALLLISHRHHDEKGKPT